jgi:hypothetical protein
MIGLGIDDFKTPQEIRNQHPKVENEARFKPSAVDFLTPGPSILVLAVQSANDGRPLRLAAAGITSRR